MHCSGEFISNIVTRDKKTADLKVALNIKELNDHIEHLYFKMNPTENILGLVSKDCFMASIDLKDAYFVDLVASEQRKFHRFFCEGKLYQFCCIPFGLSPVPRVITKLMTPAMLVFRRMGQESEEYIDDISLMGRIMLATQQNFNDTKTVITNLGIIINDNKSVLTPTKKLMI